MDPSEIDHLARLARLDLTAAERGRFALDLERIVDAAGVLRGLDLDGVKPWTSASDRRETLLRSDAPEPGLDREVALEGAPRRTAEGFLVPRVVGGGGA